MVGPLNFSLIIDVPDTMIINSLLTMVCERMKKISRILQEARIVEIFLSQEEEEVTAQVTLAYNEQMIKEKCRSKIWDVAFLNALDKVVEKMKMEIDLVDS